MDEIVINYHVTERCNYSCKYCFAKYGLENSYLHELHNDFKSVKILLEMIYDYTRKKFNAKVVRLNIAGGEPLLVKSLTKILDCAIDVGFKISLITNGSPLKKKFIEKNASKFSVIGISIDSFSLKKNADIGRIDKSNRIISFDDCLNMIGEIRKRNSQISIKINTVVSEYNYNEILFDSMNRINPDKWKIFKQLGHSEGSISDDKFRRYIDNNASYSNAPVFVEDNEDMVNSYLMIDPMGRFYQNTGKEGTYIYSDSIIETGVKHALDQVTFGLDKFKNRYVPTH